MGVLKTLSIQEVYSLFPSQERPEYYDLGCRRGRYRPAEDECAFGSRRRFQCRSRGKGSGRGCEDPPVVNLAAHLEREQDGQVTEFGSQILPFHAHVAPFTHEKSMHLADRLSRAGMVAADDACRLAST